MYKGSLEFIYFEPSTPQPPLSSPLILIHISTMCSQSSSRQFRIPDLFASCSLKAVTNPYYKEAAAESRAWINSYNVFTDRKRADFVQGQNELLCAYVYPYAGYEKFRTTCDFVRSESVFCIYVGLTKCIDSGQLAFHRG